MDFQYAIFPLMRIRVVSQEEIWVMDIFILLIEKKNPGKESIKEEGMFLLIQIHFSP